MPNWCFNELTISKEYVDKIVTLPEGESDYTKGYADFNIVVPMPESLNVTSGSSNNEDIYIYLSNRFEKSFSAVSKMEEAKSMDKFFLTRDSINRLKEKFEGKDLEEHYKTGEILVNNFKEYGAVTWYKWCCANWGVKWNASDSDISENKDTYEISFYTPWGPPVDWLYALNEAGIPFYLEWHEEQGYHGCYTGDDRGITEEALEFEGYDDEYDDEEYDGEEAEV